MSEDPLQPQSPDPEIPPAQPVDPTVPPTAAPPLATQETYTKEQTDKKLIAGILAIVVGAFGVHKFFLGYQKEGIIMLIIGLVGIPLCGFPTIAVAVVGIIEGILYLTKTDSDFVSTYVIGRKPWF